MIQFRPHHFICTLGFQGKGYSNFFIKNYEKIIAQLNEDPGTLIQVVCKTDSICQACPRREDALCEHQDSIERIDDGYQQILGLQENQVLSWDQAKEKVKDLVTLDQFHFICQKCEWKRFGVCEGALKRLLDLA